MVFDSLLAEFRHFGAGCRFGPMPFNGTFPFLRRGDFILWRDPARSGIIPPGRLTEQDVWVFQRLAKFRPHAGQCSVLRSPALLTPSPLDNKQPFNPTQRTGSQRWKLNVKDLDVVNRERFGLFGLAVLGVNTQNFARFLEISSRFAVFFAFFCRWAEFLPNGEVAGGFSGRGLQDLPALQSMGGDIAVHGGRSFCHAMAVCRFGALPKGEAHHVGTLYNGCAGAR